MQVKDLIELTLQELWREVKTVNLLGTQVTQNGGGEEDRPTTCTRIYFGITWRYNSKEAA